MVRHLSMPKNYKHVNQNIDRSHKTLSNSQETRAVSKLELRETDLTASMATDEVNAIAKTN
jgi:hypothetical protein